MIYKMSSFCEPLFVNTDFEYELDMRRFPGWEDPIQRYQPKLLIHQPDSCLCNCVHDADDLNDVQPEVFFHQTELEELTDYLTIDTKELNFDWEAQLSPISIPTMTPEQTDNRDSYTPSKSVDNHLKCSRKRKFSCLEDFTDCEENICKKIHIDTEAVWEFLNLCGDNNFKEVSHVHNKGGLCRGS